MGRGQRGLSNQAVAAQSLTKASKARLGMVCLGQARLMKELRDLSASFSFEKMLFLTRFAFEKLNTALGEKFRRSDHVRGFRVAAEGDNWRVFEEQKDVADLFCFAQVDELLLQAQACRVINGTELDERDQTKSISPRRHRGTEKNVFIS